MWYGGLEQGAGGCREWWCQEVFLAWGIADSEASVWSEPGRPTRITEEYKHSPEWADSMHRSKCHQLPIEEKAVCSHRL